MTEVETRMSNQMPSAPPYSAGFRAVVSSLFIRVLAAALIAGCKSTHQPATQPTTAAIVSTRIVSISGHRADADDPRDPQPAVNAMVHLDVYTLQLPIGAVSGSRTFWKTVDEQAVGVATEDRLFKNGIRTGIALKSEGAFFSQFFDREVIHKRSTTANGLHADTIELELGKKLDTEDLFYFDNKGQHPGRTFDRCTNSLAVGYGPTPRDPGGVRLTLCPVVKCESQRLLYTSANQDYETPATDEIVRLYNIGFSVDLPENSFFIIAPVPDASRISIGGQFLIQEDKSERLEQVIVIVPTFLRMDGKPVSVQHVVN